nr:PREDICTED: uncharacterized protein LOC105664289 isoform X2 [Megachile rotundata]
MIAKSTRMRVLTLLLIVSLISAVVSSALLQTPTCSSWKGKCQRYEDCCRYLVCPTYEGRCILEPGIIVPGEDNRPIGNGPFPPGYPNIETTSA